jgi:hypothetical protein
MGNSEQAFGRLIFEMDGATQKKRGLFGKKSDSHLEIFERGVVIEELGDRMEILKRNIVNIYYSAPMMSDYDCVTVEIDHNNDGELNTYPLDEATWPGIFARVDKLLDGEWNEFRKPKTDAPDNVKWFNAVNAVIALVGEGDPELFGGDVKSPEVAVASRDVLYESWSVNSRQDLLDQIESLFAGRSGGFAWDLARLVWIASLGWHADYLSYEEAVGYCTSAGKRLQSLFGGWDEYFYNYIQGYIYWSGEDHEDEESKAYQRLQIYSWLKSLLRSPYRIDWNMNL